MSLIFSLDRDRHGSQKWSTIYKWLSLLSFLFIWGCSKQPGAFHDVIPVKEQLPNPENIEANPDPGYGQKFNYAIQIRDYETIVPADGEVVLVSGVSRAVEAGLNLSSTIPAERLEDWKVRFFVDEQLVGDESYPVGEISLSFEAFKGQSGYKVLHTEFTNELLAKKSVVSKRIYIDEFPPKIFFNQLLEIRSVSDIQTLKYKRKFSDTAEEISGFVLSWNVSDDIGIMKDSFFIFSCQDLAVSEKVEPGMFVQNGELNADGCRMEYSALELSQLSEQNQGKKFVEKVYTLDQAQIEIGGRTYMFYAKDKAGYEAVQRLSNSKIDRRRLVSRLVPVISRDSSTALGVDPNDPKLFYSKNPSVFLKPSIQIIDETLSAPIDVPSAQAVNENWNLHVARDRINYDELNFSNPNHFNQVFEFSQNCENPGDVSTCDDLDEFFYYVRNEDQQSPLEVLRVRYDANPPKILDTKVRVDANLLLQGSKVSIDWKVADPEGSPVRGYQVTVRRLSDLERKLEDEKNGIQRDPSEYYADSFQVFFPGNNTLATDRISTKFYWGYSGVYDENGKYLEKGSLWSGNNSKSELFDVFISVVDAAGNVSPVASKRFYPQVFNAALVTQDVECLFCHLHVYGDIVGINFPEDPYGEMGVIHSHAGEGMLVEGKIIANNKVPMIDSDIGYDTTWDFISSYARQRVGMGQAYESIKDSISAYILYGENKSNPEPTAGQLADVNNAYQNYLNSLPAGERDEMEWQQNGFRERAVFGYKSEYNEEVEEYRVFPRSEDGKIGFPDIDTDSFAEQMTGTLRFLLRDIDGNEIRPYFIQRKFTGNIYISGTKHNPIQISGEVFVDGNIILSGYFEGRGTIYAHNIFIPDNLVAMDSPFPFAKPDYAKGSFEPAQAQARKVLLEDPDHDALYLGAVVNKTDAGLSSIVDRRSGRIVVGGPGKYEWGGVYPFKKNMPTDYIGSSIADLTADGNRYVGGVDGFLGVGVLETFEDYRKLGTTASVYKRSDGSDIARDFVWEWGAQKEMDVSRIDSYLYATTGLLWQSYGNILLNGGFMSPEVKITSRVTTYGLRQVSGSNGSQDYVNRPYSVLPFTDPNAWSDSGTFMYPWKTLSAASNLFYNLTVNEVDPRNGMPIYANWIRYDFRLQSGGSGFESLRTYFNYSNKNLGNNDADDIDLPDSCDPVLDPGC